MFVFNGDRYSTWKKRIILKLEYKDDWRYVNRSRPTRRRKLKKYLKFQRKAKGIIARNISHQLLPVIDLNNSVRAIFRELDDTYEQKTYIARQSIRRKIRELKYNGDNLKKHFAIFNGLYEELVTAGKPVDEPDKIADLFETMPNNF